jgi:hypothetical protein
VSQLLSNIFRDRIGQGLKRRSLTKISEWATRYRIMGQPYPGPWSFDHHPWLREMHDSQAEYNHGQKAAQMGFTECGLNITFGNLDLFQRSVLYVLPATTPDATDFSASRFDPAIELSEHLAKLFTNVKNVGHKRAGSANLFIRGSRSRTGLKSVPCPIVIFDEVDEMTQEHIPLAYERASGQTFKQFWHFSTPTVDNFGINKLFVKSNQEHYFFRCPGCSKLIELTFEENFKLNEEEPTLSYYFCKCGKVLSHEEKPEYLKDKASGGTGIWVPQNQINDGSRGFHIPQLYSCTVRPGEFAKTVLKARYDPAEEQELFNSKLGLPHVREGARITDYNIETCIGNHSKKDPPPQLKIITMGVDVGSWLHYEVNQWNLTDGFCSDLNMRSHCKVLDEGKVKNFDDLDKLMGNWQVLSCIIDANPERRKAQEFCHRFFGHIKMCFYARGMNGKHISQHEDIKVSVDRTTWMDIALGRFQSKSIQLPQDVSQEYREMIKIPARIYEKDENGNPIGRYVGEGDHAAHARVYNEIALLFAGALKLNKDVKSFL